MGDYWNFIISDKFSISMKKFYPIIWTCLYYRVSGWITRDHNMSWFRNSLLVIPGDILYDFARVSWTQSMLQLCHRLPSKLSLMKSISTDIFFYQFGLASWCEVNFLRRHLSMCVTSALPLFYYRIYSASFYYGNLT